ncbi:hypothetical protein EAO82_07270 [Halopseudomonas pelagia]|uniref:YHYH domain-containing protein n=1 Tax=Halopseudomonas pelagia TaxID=553151 RepID=A0AA91U3N0_9GAMM|nr:hypothetical protein CO192_09125 [Halopseudomonas pelagia]QFY56180.1 hypothetical protein EAO82_07270 [Halopseudomonas pelagia]
MRAFAVLTILALLFSLPVSASVSSRVGMTQSAEAIMHGGGCRKSSPPGQCCHMETSTGTVHCH